MAVITKKLSFSTREETDLINITENVQKFVKETGLKNGIATVFVPGSTAAVSTIEFEPNLVSDFREAMERLIPSDIKYRHTETWGDDNGKSHVRAALMGSGITVPFQEGRLVLGKWQQIVLIDFDVPAREREVVLQAIGE